MQCRKPKEKEKICGFDLEWLEYFRNEIENMPEGEIRIEESNKVVDIVEKSLDFNNKNQTGYKLKTLMPDQMRYRLPITLAQLQVLKIHKNLKMR